VLQLPPTAQTLRVESDEARGRVKQLEVQQYQIRAMVQLLNIVFEPVEEGLYQSGGEEGS
jgi:hypothetical protein